MIDRNDPKSLKELLELEYAPTDEQCEVINMSRDGVHLVLAGAGSGKTETMSMRAMWMIATGGVRPEEVLGLTFTRKAANELSERFRRFVTLLNQNRKKFEEAGFDLGHLSNDTHGFFMPTVSTYNAFASQIFSENAARIGWDSDTPVITEATAYGIAREVVMKTELLGLAELDISVDAIVAAVIRLSSELAEFEVEDTTPVIELARAFAEMRTFAFETKGALKVVDRLDKVAALEHLIPLAREYSEAKRSRGVEYADQVTFARRIINQFTDVRDSYRNRFKIVILDEYQDTSYAQTKLFTELFGPKRITAVGDPNQSIYGWRGASPANVASFFKDFGLSNGNVKTLLTTWRNGTKILAAANAILEHRVETLPLDVDTLKAAPTATTYPIDATFAPTIAIEADRTAQWFLERAAELRENKNTGVMEPPTLAMLVEKRTHLHNFLTAFDRAGVKYHVLGVAGVLSNPFTADLYCALSVISDPSAGARLIRLLGGSRWRVSVDDIWALHGHARNLIRNYTNPDQRSRLSKSLVADEADSLIDALDDLRFTARDKVETEESKGISRVKFSDDGWERLRKAARFFAELRGHVDLSIPDMVSVTTSRLGLDVEAKAVLAHKPDAHLEAFNDLVHSYLAISQVHSLRGFVDWVSAVERKEKNSPRTEAPEPGTVQILTIHTSKGLEWDVVALPMWTRRADPKTERGFRGDLSDKANELGWLNLGALPRVFRKDKDYLPEFTWEDKTTLDELNTEFSGKYTTTIKQDGYSARLKKEIYLPEERRLMYVAVTRARHRLHISGSWWVNPIPTKPFQVNPAKSTKSDPIHQVPSFYFYELCDAEDEMGNKLIVRAVIDEFPAENPTADKGMLTWPRDPLGSAANRARYESAADKVRSSSGALDATWIESIERLTAQRETQVSEVPTRIPASRYAEWAMDISIVKEGNRRPVPSRPYRAARIGTEMHLWIEKGNFDEGPMEFLDTDPLDDGVNIDELKAKFLASRWYGLKPEFSEIEILLPQGRHVVVCKIDAVFNIDGRWAVVDWKTGAKPATDEEKDVKAMQLVLYRRAFAAWKGIPVEDVDAILYYVKHDWEWAIEPDRLARLDALPIFE
ncbi:MAG: UvrD-helicase domain-containing protein [Microbacteriaceae bacterium]